MRPINSYGSATRPLIIESDLKTLEVNFKLVIFVYKMTFVYFVYGLGC